MGMLYILQIKGVLTMFQNKEVQYKGVEVLSLLGVATFLTFVISIFIS